MRLLFSTLAIAIISLLSAKNSDAACTKVYFYFIGNNLTDIKNMTSTSNFASLSNTYFSSSKTTVFYTGGWLLDYNSFDAQTIFSAYLDTRKSTHNLVYVDWSYYSSDLYYVPMIQNLDCVSRQVSATITKFKSDTFVSHQSFHFIGFDYGAHLLAYSARYLPLFSGTVKRITALDPAAALDFTVMLFTRYLITPVVWTDADFVDVIHTSAGKFGYSVATGHVDFYVNGGLSQNGCTFLKSLKEFRAAGDLKQFYLLLCSHARAVYYYAESVRRPNTSPLPFLCARCNLEPICTPDNCHHTSDQVSMGFYAYNPPGVGIGLSKRFYVATTNGSAQYSLT